MVPTFGGTLDEGAGRGGGGALTVPGSRFPVPGSGFVVRGSGFVVLGSGFVVLGSSVWVLGVAIGGCGSRVSLSFVAAATVRATGTVSVWVSMRTGRSALGAMAAAGAGSARVGACPPALWTEPDPKDPGTQEPGTQEPGTQEPGTQEPGTGNLEPGTWSPHTTAATVATTAAPMALRARWRRRRRRASPCACAIASRWRATSSCTTSKGGVLGSRRRASSSASRASSGNPASSATSARMMQRSTRRWRMRISKLCHCSVDVCVEVCDSTADARGTTEESASRLPNTDMPPFNARAVQSLGASSYARTSPPLNSRSVSPLRSTHRP